MSNNSQNKENNNNFDFKIIFDKYIIGEKIGKGSFGTVFTAINKGTNEKVAIKKLKQKHLKHYTTKEIIQRSIKFSLKNWRYNIYTQVQRIIDETCSMILPVYQFVEMIFAILVCEIVIFIIRKINNPKIQMIFGV